MTGTPTRSAPSSAKGTHAKRRARYSLTAAQISDLAHFIHQRVYDTLRGSPIFVMHDILTGDARGRQGLFPGRRPLQYLPLAHWRPQRHRIADTSRPLSRRSSSIPGPWPGGEARGRGGESAAANPAAKPVTLTVTPPSGPAVTGTPVIFDDFDVAVRDASGRVSRLETHPRSQGREERSLCRARRVADAIHRQEYARHSGLLGDPEMKLLGICAAAAGFVAAALWGQTGLDPRKLLQPPIDTWPMYHGDYSGRRFSTLTGINSSNMQALSLAWIYRTGVGGIKATPLEINGVLYFSAPDLRLGCGRPNWP